MNDSQVEKKHLLEIMELFHKRALTFRGKIHDNVLSAFDELDIEDQKNLLRGTVLLYTMLHSKEIFQSKYTDTGDLPEPESAKAVDPSGNKDNKETMSKQTAGWLSAIPIFSAFAWVVAMGDEKPEALRWLETTLTHLPDIIAVFFK